MNIKFDNGSEITSIDGEAVRSSRSGVDYLSREHIRGYTQAIQDLQEIFEYIQSDLKYHKKNLTGKLSLELLSCCLENRDKIRDGWNGFIRYNSQKKKFEWKEELN